MEVVRYAIVFLVVGWGGGLIAGLLSAVEMTLLSGFRGTDAARLMGAGLNGAATALAVYLAHLACQWTGGTATYAMFLPPLVGMVLNDRWRIRRAKTARSIAGHRLDEDPELRAGVVRSERMNLVADLAGLAVGVWLVPVTELV